MFAWSPIDYGVKRDDTDKTLILERTIVPLGAEVSASDLGLEEDSDEWQTLVRSGAVREYGFPEELQDPNTSAQKIVSARLVAISEGIDTGNLDSTLVADLMEPARTWTEGQMEVSPEGEVTPAQETPPPATSGLPS